MRSIWSRVGFVLAFVVPNAVLPMQVGVAEPLPGPTTWIETLMPMSPRPSGWTPPPSPPIDGLPHWVRLGPAERDRLAKLTRTLDEVEALVARGKPLSAREILNPIARLATQWEAEMLVLRLHPDWLAARKRLDLVLAHVDASLAKGDDPESLAASASAAATVEPALAALEKAFPRLAARAALAKMQAVRVLLDRAGARPHLVANQAWIARVRSLDARLDRMETAISWRIGQDQLLEGIARMATLHANAKRRLSRGQFEAALGDFQALEEACASFRVDLKELMQQGYNPAGLRFEGPTGPLTGSAFLEQVNAWQADALRRFELVERARRDKALGLGESPDPHDAPPQDQDLLPPTVPAGPPMRPPAATPAATPAPPRRAPVRVTPRPRPRRR